MRPRGFTMIEMVVVTGLFATLVVVVFGQLAALRRSSETAARGAAELSLGMKWAERFREEVRTAKQVSTSPQGDTVVLTQPGGVIGYALSSQGRLERSDWSGLREEGPALCSVQFSWSPGASKNAEQPMLRARWVCQAEADTREGTNEPKSSGRIIVLDTAPRIVKGETP